MRRIIDNDYLTLIFRLIVGVVFVYASIYKIIEPASFAKSIWFYHMVPGNMINLIAIFLPWLELFVGIALIFGCNYRGAVVLVNLMMLLFMIALASAVSRGISIDCGCFKAAQASDSSAMDALIRDIGLLIMTVQLLLSKSKKFMCDK